MIMKIENLKKSERGIEVIGWMPYASCVRVAKTEANKAYIAAKREFERLHLGDAELVQAKVESEDNE